MAEIYPSAHDVDRRRRLSPAHYASKGTGSTIVATFAALAIGSPLLGLSACALIATTALLAVTAPPLLLFSPIIVPAALVIAASIMGFGFSALMALAGLLLMAFALRSATGVLPEGLARKVKGMVFEKGEGMREAGMEFGGYLEDKGKPNKA